MKTAHKIASWAIDVAFKESQTRGVDVPALPNAVRQVYLIASCEPAFAGIESWLQTGAADWALETMDAFLEIGAVHTAKVLQRALAVFPKGAPRRSVEEREDQLEALNLSEQFWRKLDDDFVAAHDADDVHGLVGAYAAKHAKVFRLDERPAIWPPPEEPRALTPYDVEVIAMLERGARKN